MRRIFILTLSFLLLISLWACANQTNNTQPSSTQATVPNPTPTTTEDHPTIVQQPMIAASMPVITQNFEADNGKVLVRHIYQNLELIVPDQDVTDTIIIDYLNRTDKYHTTAEELYSDAKSAHDAETLSDAYYFQTTFTPMRLDGGVFSLLGNTITHKGHAHPEVTAESVTYDLTTGNPLTFSHILQPNADMEILRSYLLAALQAQEDTVSFYEDYKNTVTQLFQNPANWYFSETGLVFYYSPYEIAPYSSGVITAEIEYGKLSGILNDAYFPAETDKFNGQLLTDPFDVDEMAQFSQIAEVICSQNDKQCVLYTDGILKDLRIVQQQDHVEYTVFAAQYLSHGDGITVYVSQDDIFNIHYIANDDAITKTLRFTTDGTPQLAD